jgi:hypothetical protein
VFGIRPSAKILVNNQLISCLLDTGAGMSVISEELSDFLNLKLSPTNIGVIGVSSIETKAIGKVDFIYEFQGCEKCLEITVLKNPSCSLLLGSQFMFDSHLRLTPFARKTEIFYFKNNKFEVMGRDNPIVKFKALVCEPSLERIKRIEERKVKINKNISRNTNIKINEKSKVDNLIINREVDDKEFVSFYNQKCNEVVDCLVNEKVIEEVSVNSCGQAFGKSFSESERNGSFSPREELLKMFDLSHLEGGQLKRVQDLIWKNEKAFARDDYDIGYCDWISQAIETDPKMPHRKCRPHRYSKSDREIIDEICNELLKRGLIRKSNSSVASPVVLVKAKQKSPRLTMDYRWLNKFLKMGQYPTNNTKAILESIKKFGIGSLFDLVKSFHHVPIREEDKYKTAFITETGLYEWNVLPQGLAISPQVLQFITDTIVGEHKWRFLNNFIDDLLANSSDFEEHFRHVQTLLTNVIKYKVKLKPSKCQMFKEKLKFLGFWLSPEGISMDSDRVSAITNMPRPTNTKQILSFMGMITFVSDFIPDVARHSEALYSLTRKNVTFDWGFEQEKSFNYLKRALTSSPVLTYPDDDCKKVILCDASNFSIGGLICQIEKKKGKEQLRILAYYHKSLNKFQRNWSTIEKELFAILVGVRKYGRELLDMEFDVYTDHMGLMALNKLKDFGNNRLKRWAIELSSYRFKVIYIKGKLNCAADFLSRLEYSRKVHIENKSNFEEIQDKQVVRILDPNPSQEEDIDICISNKLILFPIPDPEIINILNDINDRIVKVSVIREEDVINQLGLEKSGKAIDIKDLIDKQEDDLFCSVIKEKLLQNDRKFLRLKYRFRVFNEVLYRRKRKTQRENNNYQIVLPESMVARVLKEYHDSTSGGRLGQQLTEENIERFFWFPNMREVIRTYVKKCKVCQTNKTSNKVPFGIPQSYQIPTQPFESINIDICGPIQRSKSGNRYIVVAVDRMTRYMIAKAIPDMKAKTIINFIQENIVLKYNTPSSIITDRAQIFFSEAFKKYMTGLGINHKPTSAYNPSSDGLVKVSNRKLITVIRSYCTENSKNWDSYIDLALKCLNKSKNSTTGYSSFYLLFGYSPINPLERKLGLKLIEDNDNEAETSATNSWLDARAEALNNIKRAEAEMKANAEKKCRKPDFKVGSLVWLIDRSAKVDTPSKLRKPIIGPWIICKIVGPGVYHVIHAIKKRSRKRCVNARLCLPFYGPKPRRWQSLVSRIENGEFENERLESNEIWDVEDLDAYEKEMKGITNETNNYINEENEETIIYYNSNEQKTSQQNSDNNYNNQLTRDLVSDELIEENIYNNRRAKPQRN